MKKFKILFSVCLVSTIGFYACNKNEAGQLENSLSSQGVQRNAELSDNAAGAVYVLSNAANGNQVMIYRRSPEGILSWSSNVPTGGKGTGAGLGSQGAVILHQFDGIGYVLAVNAGSNEISVLRQDGNSLVWVDKISSHGTTPISVTAHNNLVYVVNAGGTGNISGFQIGNDGHLTYLSNSTRALGSNDAGPAEILFNNDGSQIAVTEKNTNQISTFTVKDGIADPATVHPSVGITPFGFAFDNHDHLLATDAFGGAAGQSAVTSYDLTSSGKLTLVDGPSATHQTSACWLAVTNNGKYCYATNTGSGTISGYSVNDGILKLLNSDGVTATTGTTPGDVTLTANSKFLYNLNSTSHSITLFQVNQDGSLSSLGSIEGLPVGSVGIAAR